MRSDRLASVLSQHGWVELSSSLSFKELVLATDFLDQAYGESADLSDYSYFDGFELVMLKPSTLQFFYDLYGFGSSLEPVDVLVSYISDTERQEYIRYSGADPGDVQSFFQAIHNPTLNLIQRIMGHILQDTDLDDFIFTACLVTCRIVDERATNQDH